LIRETTDVYAAREAVRALCKIDTKEVMEFLSTLLTHPDKVVRKLVRSQLDKN
jgi:HEAT repeat protein